MSADLKMLESIQNTQSISREELDAILQTQDSFLIQELHKKAQQTATQIYGNKIYIRGLIEFTNYCKNNCFAEIIFAMGLILEGIFQDGVIYYLGIGCLFLGAVFTVVASKKLVKK